MFAFANLDKEQIREVQEFECAEGVRVLALKEVSLDPEMLQADKLMALHELERKLGVCLLAVR